jgi:NADH:ubiquinone oxidoreductase subunit 2 (subunit N)
MAKFLLFSSTIQECMTWLEVIAILNSALSLYYYARLVRCMYFLPPEGKKSECWPSMRSSSVCSGLSASNGSLARTFPAVGYGTAKVLV